MVLLASIGSTPYNLMMLLHVLAAIVGFAPAWLTPALMRLSATGDGEAADALELSILRYSLPGLGLTAFFGFGLAGMSDKFYKMSQFWLSSAVVLWLVLMLVLVFVARPAIKAFRDGDTAARGRVMAATGVSHLFLVALLYLMVFKPGL